MKQADAIIGMPAINSAGDLTHIDKVTAATWDGALPNAGTRESQL